MGSDTDLLTGAGPDAVDVTADLLDDDAPTDPGVVAAPALAPAPEAPAAEDTPWRRLHPASLVVNLIPQAWRTVRGAWPLLLALVFGGAGMGVEIFDLSLIFAFFVVALTRTTVHFLTLRYRVHAGRFEVQVGLLNRQARALDPERIQNVSLVRNVFHRVSGLVEVRVETAGDASTAGTFSALSVADAEALQADLKALVREAEIEAAAVVAADPETGEAPAPSGEALVTISPLELIAFGFSKRTVGTVAVLTAVGMEIMTQLGPEGADQVRWMAQPRVLFAAVLLAFAGSWAWSAGTALFRHWGFALRRKGDRLLTNEGLATKRAVEIPLRKVQIVQVVEPLLRRLMGFGTVLVETAALGFADGQVRQAEGVVPMVDRESLPGVVRAASPMVAVDPWRMELHPAHPRALYRAVIQRALGLSPLLAGLGWIVDPIGWWAATGLVLALPLAFLDWRWQRWAVTDRAIVARRGFLTRRTWVIARSKLQSVHVHQTLMMRWHGLGRVHVRVAGTDVALPDIAVDRALEVLAELRPSGPSPRAPAPTADPR